nr:hypothetical protein [Neisseria meningitidis]
MPSEAYFQGNARLAAGGMGNADACFNRLPLCRLAAGAAETVRMRKCRLKRQTGFRRHFFI